MNGVFDLAGKSAVIVTKHGKERVIAPALRDLGLSVLPAPSVDTDQFGTFARTVRPAGTPTDTLLAKALVGFATVPRADYAVASEGWFGPHPASPALLSGSERVALVERRSGKMIIGRDLSIQTNFAQTLASNWCEVERFARSVGFPKHALVVMRSHLGPIAAEGVVGWEELAAAACPIIDRHRRVWLETDMRAHVNPKRMRAIAFATDDLARRLGARCPRCDYPDWAGKLSGGRPCSSGAGPNTEACHEVFGCAGCSHGFERLIEPTAKLSPAIALAAIQRTKRNLH